MLKQAGPKPKSFIRPALPANHFPDSFMLRIGLTADTIAHVVEADVWKSTIDSSLTLLDSPEVQLHSGEIGTEPLSESYLPFKILRAVSENGDDPYLLVDYQRGWLYSVPVGKHRIKVEFSLSRAWARSVMTDLRALIPDLPRVTWFGQIVQEYILEVDREGGVDMRAVGEFKK